MPVDVLLIGAHPDDIEWSVGGIALLLCDHGVSLAVVDMTEGEMGSRGTVDERRIEASAAAGTIGAEARENLQLPDCGLVDGPDARRAVSSAIRRHKPRVVIAPLWEDRHPDHAAAGLIVQNSRMLCGLTTFDDSNPPHRPAAFLYYPIHTFHQPTFVVDTLNSVRTQAGSAADLSFAVRHAGGGFSVQTGVARSLLWLTHWRAAWRSAGFRSANAAQ